MTPSRVPPTPRVQRAVGLSMRGFGVAVTGARACLDGFWLGVLSPRQIAVLDEAYYSGIAAYTAEDYNRQGLYSWEAAAAEKHFADRKHVVVTAAGGGREVLALARMGFEVTGFEVHPRLREFAVGLLATEGLAATVLPCERDDWPAGAEQADAVVSGWGQYMCIRGRARRVAFLRGAARTLPEGGPILVSFFARAQITRRMRTTAAVGNVFRPLLHGERVEVGDSIEQAVGHAFSREEIAQELRLAGFDLVDFGPANTNTATDDSTVNSYGWAVGRRRAEVPEPSTEAAAPRGIRAVPTAVRTVRRGLHPRHVKVAALGVAVELGLRVLRLPRLAALLGIALVDGADERQSASSADAPDLRRTVYIESVDRVLRRWPCGNTCLRRALVLGALLRRERPVLMLGVKRDEAGETAAHAWIEIDGVSLDDSAVDYRAFRWAA